MHSHSNSHTHSHNDSHNHTTVENIRLAFFLNLAFAILELFGGFWTNSLAIVSDAVHDLGDSLSLAMAWFLEEYAGKGGDRRFSYGYRRFSLLGALANTLVLIVGSIFVIREAVLRLMAPEPANASGMVVFALVGIAVNGFAVLRLRSGGSSMNARVVAWHLLEDVFGWVAVLVVSVILLFTDFYILDPLLSIGITAFILFNVLSNLRRTLSLFLQAVPENIDIESVEKDLGDIDQVRSIHHTHVWSLDGERHVLSTHLVVDETVSLDVIQCLKQDIRDTLQPYHFEHTTVEIEFGDRDCRMAE